MTLPQSSEVAVFAGLGNLAQAACAALPEAMRIGLTPEGDLPMDEVLDLAALGGLFDRFRTQGITHVIFAGAIARPQGIDLAACDGVSQQLLTQVLPVMGQGDDAALRVVQRFFETSGFQVLSVPDILPGLVLGAGQTIGNAPTDEQRRDAARGQEVLATLASLDIGQAVVIEAGLCLGVETLQGTDALLGFVAQTPAHLRRAKGVLIKLPKSGQTESLDLPTIGKETCLAAQNAGLSALAIRAGKTLVLDQDWMHEHLAQLGLSLFTIEVST